MSPVKNFPKKLLSVTQSFCHEVPSLTKTHEFINDTVNFLFPIRIEKSASLLQLEATWEELQLQFKMLLVPFKSVLKKTVDELTHEFFSNIPEIHDKLLKDAEAFLKFFT